MLSIDPSHIEPTRDRILVRSYERPEKIGQIIVPDSYRHDAGSAERGDIETEKLSYTLWEVVRAGPDVEDEIGMELKPDDILHCRQRPPVDLGVRDAEGRSLYIIGAESNEIMHVTRWKG